MGLKRGRVESRILESPLLARNPLGDPASREITVCLPPGYDDEPDRRYPVVLALTGYSGSGYMLLNRSAWSPNLPERMDALIARGEAGPMILLAPDCFTRLGGSQYLDSEATGLYQRHLIEEVIPWVEQNYRARGGRDGWGVVGKSSGGYGALILAMRHPERFAAAACHSGDMYFEYCYLPDFPKTARAIQTRGSFASFLAWFEALPKKTSEGMTAMNVVAMASCYSPRVPHPGPGSPDLGIDLPFRVETGELREETWERWLTHDPVRMAGNHLPALASLELLYIDCGARDEFNLQFGARILRERLERAGVRCTHEEYDDGHMNVSYRYDRSLALLSRALCA